MARFKAKPTPVEKPCKRKSTELTSMESKVKEEEASVTGGLAKCLKLTLSANPNYNPNPSPMRSNR